ncbi:MAG: DNA-protecting protein DprA [Hyphomicrobiaceae bacterium]|nr:MAG: DNA-protecting protein DprA [Hyphomicrobiaceae bacterium]
MSCKAASIVPGPSRPITDEQRLAWLRLIRTDGIGPITHRELVNQFGGAIEAIAALPDLARRGGRKRPLPVYPDHKAAREIDDARRLQAFLVAPGDEGYPPWLWHAHGAPPMLFVKGQREIAAKPIVGIVGARNASVAGQKIARLIAAHLGEAGLVVGSGLARGIDAAAHKAALSTGTIAALAGGIDVVYPPEHQALQASIGEIGLLMTEQPPGYVPRAQDFPRRNRLIAGMAAGIVIVEAARRSGSLITARLATEIGREVMAVPGNPLDPRAEGTNGLLRQGATLVRGGEDVVEAIRPIIGLGEMEGVAKESLPELPAVPERAAMEHVTTDARETIIASLGPAPADIDEIVRATQIHIGLVRIVLLELDLAGRLERHPGALVSLR